MIETLTCKAGHSFTREATRGRKPVWCPKHDPRFNELPAKSIVENFICEICHAPFSRSPKRGRKPMKCSSCAPVVQRSKSTSKEETLYCEVGKHDWVRSRTRGKRPSSCPDHRKLATVSTRPQILGLAELKRQYHVDYESALVIKAIEDAINHPDWPQWREPEDIRILIEAYNTRVRAIKRNSRPIPTPVDEVTT